MIQTIIKGIVIGIAISAPMGPIGVLCIKRTLREGRLSGFISGLGATLSDLIYAIISVLGVSFVMNFINSNRYSLQIIGGLFLAIIGYFIYKSNPVKELLKEDVNDTSHVKNFLSSFFINLSNVTIFFGFLALFAKFNFIHPDTTTAESIMGIVSIGVGTTLWWFFVSKTVDKVRSKFNPRSLKIFNSLLGVIVILLGLFGFISGIYSFFLA